MKERKRERKGRERKERKGKERKKERKKKRKNIVPLKDSLWTFKNSS